jgi:hypothetical protein
MSKISGRKKGHVLTLALLIMMVGAILLGLLLQYLGTSLAFAIKSEERAITYYAADSGVEDAFYWLQQDQEPEELWVWDEGANLWTREAYEIGDRTVAVNVEDAGKDIYRITSTATTDEGKSTRIDAYALAATYNLSPLGGGAITSNNSVRIQNNGLVNGNVSVPGGDAWRVDNKGTINGTIVPLPPPWPTAEEISTMFWQDVATLEPYPDLYINTAFTSMVGPLYRDGDLEIMSSVLGTHESLNGTIYVTGDMDIGKGGGTGGEGTKDFTLNLNGQTIFVEGTLQIYEKCTIEGKGSIIALGDILFGPKMQAGDGNYVFTMSVEGMLDFHPKGTYYGSAYGYEHVEVHGGVEVHWVGAGDAGYQIPCRDMVELLTYDILHY